MSKVIVLGQKKKKKVETKNHIQEVINAIAHKTR